MNKSMALILVAFFMIAFSSSVFAVSPVFIEPRDGQEFYLNDKVNVEVDIGTDNYDTFEFRVARDTVCGYPAGREGGFDPDDGNCEISDDTETFYWTTTYDDPDEDLREYKLEFQLYPESQYDPIDTTIYITKEPPVIEDEPVYDGNELTWNFNLSDNEFDDNGILEFYDHYEDEDSDESCVYLFKDEQWEDGENVCGIETGDDDWEYYLTYTGYDEAGNYTPRFYIDFDGEDAEDDKISEDGIQVGPEITDFSIDEEGYFNDEIDLSYKVNSKNIIDEMYYSWVDYDAEGWICDIDDDCAEYYSDEDNLHIYDDLVPTLQDIAASDDYKFMLHVEDDYGFVDKREVYVYLEEEPDDKPPKIKVEHIREEAYEDESFNILLDMTEGTYDIEYNSVRVNEKKCDKLSEQGDECEISFSSAEDDKKLNITVEDEEGNTGSAETAIDILEYIKPKIVNIHTVHNNKIWDGIIADDEHPVYEGMDFRIHVEANGIDELKLQEPEKGSSCASIDMNDKNNHMLCSQKIKEESNEEYSYDVRIGDNLHEETDSQDHTVTVEEPTPPTVKDLKGGGADGDVFYPTLETNTITATLEKGTFNLTGTELFVDGEEKEALNPEPEGEDIEIQTEALTGKEDDVEINLTVLDQFGESTERSVTLSPTDYDCFDCNDIAAEDAQDECEEMMEDHDPDTTEQVCSRPIDMNCDGKRLGRGIKEYQCHKINDEGHCDKDLGSSLICEGRFEEKGENEFWEDCECTPQISIESPESRTTYSPTNLPKIELDTNLRLAGTKPINYRLNDGPVRQYTSPFTARSTIAGTDVLRIEAFMSREAESILDDDLYVEREVKYDAPEREDPRASEEIQMENTSEEDEEFYESELERTGSNLSELASRADVDKSVESSLTANYYEGRTEMELDLKSGKNLKGTSVVLEIPKCAADLVNEVMFDDTSYEVLQDDPLVAWHFEEMDRDVNLRYEFSKELDPDCIAEMRVMSLVREVGDDRMDSFMRSPLFPLLMIPVVVSVLIYFSRFTTTGKPERVSESTEQELVKVVQRRVAEGQSDDEVISDLTQEGFDEQEVLKALKEA
ncbi:MAG: hypothetical protein ACLFNK_00840 [Candidatus Woesearchaeota archaeon]